MHASAFAFCVLFFCALDKRLLALVLSSPFTVTVCFLGLLTLKSYGHCRRKEEERPLLWAEKKLVQLTLLLEEKKQLPLKGHYAVLVRRKH
jgi:hypothetical protein